MSQRCECYTFTKCNVNVTRLETNGHNFYLYQATFPLTTNSDSTIHVHVHIPM